MERSLIVLPRIAPGLFLEVKMNDFTDDYNDRPLEPHPGDLSAILPGGVKLYGPVDFLLNSACTDYVRDGKGAFEAVKAIPEITVLDLFKFSGLTTAAWAEGLGIAEVTWYKYRNRTDVPAELRENAFVLAMEARAAVRGLRSGAAARKLRKIMELLDE